MLIWASLSLAFFIPNAASQTTFNTNEKNVVRYTQNSDCYSGYQWISGILFPALICDRTVVCTLQSGGGPGGTWQMHPGVRHQTAVLMPNAALHPNRVYYHDALPQHRLRAVTLTLRFYTQPAGGTPIGTEVHTVTTDADGAFTIPIGADVPGLSAQFGSPDLVVGLSVGTDPEIVPRRPLMIPGRPVITATDMTGRPLVMNGTPIVFEYSPSVTAKVTREYPPKARHTWVGFETTDSVVTGPGLGSTTFRLELRWPFVPDQTPAPAATWYSDNADDQYGDSVIDAYGTAGNEEMPLMFAGLLHHNLNGWSVNMAPTGPLLTHAPGNAITGPTIDVGHTAQGTLGWGIGLGDTMIPAQVPDGAFRSLTLYGTLNGRASQRLATTTMTRAGNGFQMTADFSPTGSRSQTLRFHRNGRLVREVNGFTGPAIEVASQMGVKDEFYRYRRNGSLRSCHVVTRDAIAVTSPIIDSVDEIEVIPEGQFIPVTGMDSVVFTTKDIGRMTITAERRTVLFSGHENTTIGHASVMNGEGDVLRVGDIGTLGNEGLSIDLDTVTSFSMAMRPLYLKAPNATMAVTARGIFNGTDVDLGRFSLRRNAWDSLAVDADYSAINAPNVQVVMLRGGRQIGTTTVPRGRVGTLVGEAWPTGCGKAGGLPPSPPCGSWNFTKPVLFVAADNTRLEGDELQVLASGTSGTLTGLTNFTVMLTCVDSMMVLQQTSVARSSSVPTTTGRSQGDLISNVQVGRVDGIGLMDVEFQTNNSIDLSVDLCNNIGDVVAIVSKGVVNAGPHRLSIDTRPLASGTYYIRFRSMERQRVERIVITR